MPKLDEVDWGGVKARAKKVDRDGCIVSGFVEMGLFERSYLLLGMEEALIAYLTNPDAMNDLLDAVADCKVDLIRRFDDAADLDMIWYGDDWGMRSLYQ